MATELIEKEIGRPVPKLPTTIRDICGNGTEGMQNVPGVIGYTFNPDKGDYEEILNDKKMKGGV